jgi:cytoskeleton protein RodZ
MSSQQELIPMRAGDFLRHEREQKDLSIEQAARDSRIRLSVLEAIESSETSHIPSVYLKGHIRNYARFLGLDASSIEEQIALVQGAEPEVRKVFSSSPHRGDSDKWLKVSGYLAASVMIAALAWQFTHQAVRLSQGEPGLSASVQDDPGVSGQITGPAAADRPNDRTHINASIASIEAMETAPGEPGNHPADSAWAALRNPQLPEGQHVLSLETSADTWVEIFGEGGAQLEMDLIRAGDSREYRGAGPFQVMIGRASAVVLSLDGETVDLELHSHDNVASLVLAEVAESGSETTEQH